jgi:signal transduction histidine kinase
MTDHEISLFSAASEVLKRHAEEVAVAYEARLFAMGSSLVAEANTREQLRAQSYGVLKEVARKLRSAEAPSVVQQSEDQLPEITEAHGGVHVNECLEAAIALSDAALSVVQDNLSSSSTSRSKEVADVAYAIRTNVARQVTRPIVAYTTCLLKEAEEAHIDERRRISRELHDQIAPCLMTAFRHLELCELYEVKDPSKAHVKLELAKRTIEEAFTLTRSLSGELRHSSAREGLRASLSDLVRTMVPEGIRALISVEGDETVIPSHVRSELFLILREGLRNAAVHSKARVIKVVVNIADRCVRAAVVDDGVGFERGEQSISAGGTGLAAMRERATLLGGSLDLVSVQGKGTRVEVSLLLPITER